MIEVITGIIICAFDICTLAHESEFETVSRTSVGMYQVGTERGYKNLKCIAASNNADVLVKVKETKDNIVEVESCSTGHIDIEKFRCTKRVDSIFSLICHGE